MISRTIETSGTAHPADSYAVLFLQSRADERAATKLYERCYPILVAALRRRFAPITASDAAHDGLAMAFTKRASFDSGKPFLPWVLAIATRIALDGIRREIRRGTRESSFAADAAAPGGDASFDESVLKVASQSMANLPSRQRRLLERRFFEGLSSAAIAAADGRKRSAVAVEIHRTCIRLRAVINDAAVK